MLPHCGRPPWAWETHHDEEGKKVVSLANCAPCHGVRPSATTSRRRPPRNSAKPTSQTRSLVETRAPLCTLPQRPPTDGPFSPTQLPRRTLHNGGQESSRRPHRQVRVDRGRGLVVLPATMVPTPHHCIRLHCLSNSGHGLNTTRLNAPLVLPCSMPQLLLNDNATSLWAGHR